MKVLSSVSFSAAARLTILAGVICLGGALTGARAARADSIGVNFIGAGGAASTLAAGTSAGVVAQTNWNNLSALSGTNVALKNNLGAATTTTLTYSAQNGYSTSGNNPVGGDEQLNKLGLSNSSGTPLTFTLNSISYASYDIYVYNLTDTALINQQTTLGGTSYFSSAPNPSAAGYVDGQAGTPFTYTRATSTNSATPTANANYVRFTGLSGATQSFSVTGLNDVSFVGAIQVVATPEPSTWAMMLLGAGALFLIVRKPKQSGESEAI